MNAATTSTPTPPPPPPPAPIATTATALNVQGLWWRPSESGWGVNVTQQGDVLFATWFTYDASGRGMWLVMPNGTRTGDNAYTGTLYRTTGPAFGTNFDPSQVATTAVGDRYVVEKMRSLGCNLGGEQSGHIILSDYATTGDGLIAALQVLAAIVETGKRASEVCRVFEPVPQLLRNVRFEHGRPLESRRVQRAIAAGEARLGTGGRLVIRNSGTEPVIRVMAQGEDGALLTSVVDDICEAILAVSRAAEASEAPAQAAE